MAIAKKIQKYAVDEYLRAEQSAKVRHELIDGQVYAMVGASHIHNLIATRLVTLLGNHLQAPCHVYAADMKVQVNQNFYYPDLAVSCEKIDGVTYFLSAPRLIIEILSPSTEGRDRIEKSIAYRKLPSVQEYVLIAQDKLSIEVLRRVDDTWEVIDYSTGDTVNLASVEFSIAIDKIYTDVAQSIWSTSS